jgi:hypothetical protein
MNEAASGEGPAEPREDRSSEIVFQRQDGDDAVLKPKRHPSSMAC